MVSDSSMRDRYRNPSRRVPDECIAVATVNRMGALIGRGLWFVCALLLVTATATAAKITVRADRDPVGLNESFELVFTASGTVDGQPDFSALTADFEILNQAQSSNISVINGNFSKSTAWTLDVMAKREGVLTVPAIAFGRDRSQPLPVTVTVGRDDDHRRDSAEDELLLDVEVRPSDPYVQQQVMVTVRVLHRVEIAQASLTEPELDGAIIEPLGKDRRYHTQRNGMRYSVIERSYAVFPQHSGPATLPPLQLNAHVVTGGRRPGSMFNGLFNRPTTRTRRVRSEPVRLDVRPIPEAFTGQHWLPAEALDLQQQWSSNPPAIPAGEPITRTLTLTAEGVTAGQLPELVPADQPIGSASGGAVKQYPDQPTLQENKAADGLTSSRQEKIALIPSSGGAYRIAAVTVPWWNTRTDRMEVARLPEQLLEALPSTQFAETGADSKVEPRTAPGPLPSAGPTAAAGPGTPLASWWPWVAFFLAAGWAATCVGWWTSHKRLSVTTLPDTRSISEKSAIKALRSACSANDPDQAKDALLAWAKAHWPGDEPRSLAGIADRCGLSEPNAVEALTRVLYGRQRGDWSGAELWRAFLELQRKQGKTAAPDRFELEPLYKT